MSQKLLKKHPNIGCCGIDCGLCPVYYTKGPSRCPGCCGPNFFNAHPSCSFITCCLKNKKLEVCGECEEYPCSKFDSEGKYDSFVTHQKIFPNQQYIKEHGFEKFIDEQEKRIKLLVIMLENFNEGRSKSFYCVVSALLPISDIENVITEAEKEIEKNNFQNDLKQKSKILKDLLKNAAENNNMQLKLRKKR